MEIKIRCEIVSPVHIGSGQELNPFNYVIKNDTLYKISFERLINTMSASEVKSFEDLIDSGDIVKLRQFIADYPDYDISSYTVAVTPAVEAACRSNLHNTENQMLINAFLRSANIPLIPGSSLKGSLRTALLSVTAGKKDLPKPKGYKDERFFENRILNNRDAKNNPFRAIRIRDSFLDADDIIVSQIKNVLMSGRKKENTIQMMHEISHSVLTGKPVVFDTSIFFDEKLFASGFIKTNFSIEDFIAACRHFYRDKMEYEHNRFYKGNINEAVSMQIMNTPMEDNTCFIRLGRFSGVESVTLDHYRNPRPPGKTNTWGTSRNLAEGIYPMGWVKMIFDSSKIDYAKLDHLVKKTTTAQKTDKTYFKSSHDAIKNQPVDLSVLKNKFKVIDKKKER